MTLVLLEPAKAFQPIDTQRIKDWDKVTNLTKTGKLTPEANVGQGAAPYKWLWCDEKWWQGAGTIALRHYGARLAQC